MLRSASHLPVPRLRVPASPRLWLFPRLFEPMPPLTSDQLEAIQRLLSDPLRQTVRAEMQAGHDRLAAAIDRVAEQLGRHVGETSRREQERELRIDSLDRRVAAIERFRGKVLIVYGALTFAMSFAWSLFCQWLGGMIRKN